MCRNNSLTSDLHVFLLFLRPGRVLAGAYPASLDDVETEQLLSLLLELGVNTFVCLQAEVNIHIPGVFIYTYPTGITV